MDVLTDLINRRPAGHRASAQELARLAEQAIAAGAKVIRPDAQDLRAVAEEADAQRVAKARERARNRVTVGTRVALSAAGRRRNPTP
ncbi:hypothetical protein FW320_12705 [Azospirillum sp. Vi22]|uniref:hypothetical protein n=1 Tax=Azospirillum baldaniorum TaxID=1064539 RepID=UPI00157A8055|nr:hypothetical protein [Azospirillum baldaniorum]NUB07031.1 hypothetical protein [Azospirillum baldaniorum]